MPMTRLVQDFKNAVLAYREKVQSQNKIMTLETYSGKPNINNGGIYEKLVTILKRLDQGESTQVWYRVSQLAVKHQQFTENAIRALLFAAKPRLSAKTKNGNSWIKGNGLAPAIRKCGRSVLINEPMFDLCTINAQNRRDLLRLQRRALAQDSL
jgi:hypothetical protein